MVRQFAALLVAACLLLSRDIHVRAVGSTLQSHSPRTEETPQTRLYPPFGDNIPPLHHRQISASQKPVTVSTVSAQYDHDAKESGAPLPASSILAAARDRHDVQSSDDDRYAEIARDHLEIGPSPREDADERDLSSHASPLSDRSLLTVADIERVARLKLEPQARRYFFSGADRQQTLKENTEAFKRLRFRPKLLVDVSRVNVTTTVLGHRISMPVGFSPSAMHKLAHNDGEVGTAQAAQDAGTVMILSSLSTTSLEEVRKRAPLCLLWFQTYLFRDRSITEWLVKRAAKAGYSAIVLTADSPVVGHKLGPDKNRFVLPPDVTFANLKGWHEKSNIQSGTQEDVDDFISRSVSWQDIGWLKRITGLPVVVKGVRLLSKPTTTVRLPFSVSNHGGRQLDGTPAAIEALPEIVSAVGGRLEIYMDSGVRSGADVVKALSLGARAVFVGRPAVWGLAYNVSDANRLGGNYYIERIANVKLEPGVRWYYNSGADQEVTLTENAEAFKRPRMLVDVSRVSTTTTLLGQPVSMPVGFSPSAMQQLAHPDGEIGTTQAAEAAGTVMILSSMSTTSLEEIRRRAPNCTLWLQTYLYKEPALTESLVNRAAAAGFSAIVLTADSPVFGQKIMANKYRFHLPKHLRFGTLELSLPTATVKNHPDFDSFVDDLISPSVTWSDVAWLRKVSGLPVVIKGVLTPEAAIKCYESGASAIIVSNHGGRQLDSTPASIDALPEIVDAVGSRLEVYLDSGVRTGADVARALALGARAAFVGRPVLWGLAYNGKEGVRTVLDIYRSELERTLRLLGCADVTELTPEFVVHKGYFSSRNYRLRQRFSSEREGGRINQTGWVTRKSQ
ncbi:hypothetical protein HPB50_011383 [Hyalomma asiaticum]|uniref:Uncharacterized protein n=1 Tax=Hyalomma asiaticum TaxID=266040 RepID=A0ACB7T6U9_HYAAI|nr:hypothetical protein HPB50_011383 [Hyalomma asiaticum]